MLLWLLQDSPNARKTQPALELSITGGKFPRGIQPRYLCSQEPGQVDLRHHLAAPVSLLLVAVVMVLDQVPDLDAALQVGGDHGRARAEAVGAPGVAERGVCPGQKGWSWAQQNPSAPPSVPSACLTMPKSLALFF